MQRLVAVSIVVACASGAMGQISEIPAMTLPESQMDMDRLPTGAVTAAEINAVGTNGGGALARITAPDKPSAAAGVYNTNHTLYGQGLARVGGTLSIIAASGSAAFDATTFTVDLAQPHTQFGVEIGDWNGPYILEFFSGGSSVGSITSTSSAGGLGLKFFESRSPFEQVTIDVSTTAGNFVLTEIWTEQPSVGCYPDCTGEGTLDIFDFLCFQDAFVNMDPYANCDGNATFDIFDFLCFQDEFVKGCP